MWPYLRGQYRRDILATLWQVMEADGAAGKLFHSQYTGGDEHLRGDLTEFVTFLSQPSRILLIVEMLATKEIAGFFWFDDIIPGFRASANVFYRRRAWGEPSREGSRIALQYGFYALGYQTIWAYTPWPEAVSHAEAVGFSAVADLTGFAFIGGKAKDIHILRLRRETYDEQFG